jgi:hypothetical protein
MQHISLTFKWIGLSEKNGEMEQEKRVMLHSGLSAIPP